jgi:hypothetical protein
VTWFNSPPEIWLVTVLPLLGIVVLLAVTEKVNVRQLAIDLALLGGVLLMLYPDHNLPMTYYLFSGCVAFVCYRLVSLNSFKPGTSEAVT